MENNQRSVDSNFFRENIRTFSRLWNTQTRRTQTFITALIIVTTIFFWTVFFVAPLINNIQEKQNRIATLTSQFEEISQLVYLIPKSDLLKADNSESAITFLYDSMSEKGFVGPSISSTNNLYHIEIESVQFLNLVNWLIKIKQTGNLITNNAIITRNTDSPLVKASLTLKHGI